MDDGWGASSYIMVFGFLAAIMFYVMRQIRRNQLEDDGDYKEFYAEKNVWESLNPFPQRSN